MASVHQFKKFDPEEHPGDLYNAFGEYINMYQYEYEATAKSPPAGSDVEKAAWIQQDKRRQLLGRFASRNLQKDFEDIVVAAQRSTITFDETVRLLKDRYKPTRNLTFAHYQFHKMTQKSSEAFDVFVNRVKHEASNCEFTCNDDCTVGNILIRDQIIVGTTDDSIRKEALNNQWNLQDLSNNGRKMEAASYGAQKIKCEQVEEAN